MCVTKSIIGGHAITSFIKLEQASTRMLGTFQFFAVTFTILGQHYAPDLYTSRRGAWGVTKKKFAATFITSERLGWYFMAPR